jgi:hypothetical protein
MLKLAPPMVLRSFCCTAGPYSHRVISGGIGHNLPQEAPQDFAKAVVEADGY